MQYKKNEQYGYKLNFTIKTNGTILNKEIVALFSEYNFIVHVSIDGDKKYHDKNRVDKVLNGTHDVVVNNIQTLLANNIQVVASLTITPEHSDAILETVKYLQAHGIQYVHIGPSYGTTSWGQQQISSFVDGLLSTAGWIKHSSPNIVISPLERDTIHIDDKLGDSIGCSAFDSSLALLPDGQISGCSSLAMISPQYPEMIVGNVFQGINSESLDKVLGIINAPKSIRPRCKVCKTYSNCTGGCIAMNLSDTKSYHFPPVYYCCIISSLQKAWKVAWGVRLSIAKCL